MWIERALQTDSHAGCIHSRGGALSGRYDPKQQGQPLLSTKPPPCLPAGLSLPDEEGSVGEDESKTKISNDSLDKPVNSDKRQYTISQSSFLFTNAEQCANSLLSSKK